MPDLEITQDDLESRPRIVAVYIAAIMLSPDDEDRRSQVVASGKAKQGWMRLKIREGFVAKPLSEQDAHEAIEVADLAIRAPNKDTVLQDNKRPLRFGVIAGRILYGLLVANETGASKTIPEVFGELGISNRHRIGQATIKNSLWRDYSPVAHLYLAWLTMNRNGAGRAVPLPCHAKDLPTYLALAEHYRNAGEQLRLRHRREAALDSGRTWRVPASITLPDLPH